MKTSSFQNSDEAPFGYLEPSDLYIGKENSIALFKIIREALSKRELNLLSSRLYGMTLESVGKRRKVTKEAIRQSEKKIVEKIRKRCGRYDSTISDLSFDDFDPTVIGELFFPDSADTE